MNTGVYVFMHWTGDWKPESVCVCVQLQNRTGLEVCTREKNLDRSKMLAGC